MNLRSVLFVVVALGGTGCKKDAKPPPAETKPAVQPAPTVPPEKPPEPTPSKSEVPDVPAGEPPPDGKYERVSVEGVTVPMINVMEGGTVVLVDTDGKKPRTWEEQYKKKRSDLKTGQFDLHKTDTNKSNKFDDDQIDKEGLWVIDLKGNIVKK